MILNLSAMVVALIVSFYIFFLSFKTKFMRTNLQLLALGIFISVGIHSVIELLEVVRILPTENLIVLMPILVVIGTSLVLFSVFGILKNITSAVKTMTVAIKEINSGNLSINIPEEIESEKFVCQLVVEFNKLLVSLKLAVKEREDTAD